MAQSIGGGGGNGGLTISAAATIRTAPRLLSDQRTVRRRGTGDRVTVDNTGHDLDAAPAYGISCAVRRRRPRNGGFALASTFATGRRRKQLDRR